MRPIVVFPGWLIEQTSDSSREVRVLKPKSLPGFFANEPVRIALEDVNLAAFQRSCLICDQEAKT